jgi:hypothetical protein
MFLIGLQSWFISELRTLRSQSGEHLDVLSPAAADATAVVTPEMPSFIPQPISDHYQASLFHGRWACKYLFFLSSIDTDDSKAPEDL